MLEGDRQSQNPVHSSLKRRVAYSLAAGAAAGAVASDAKAAVIYSGLQNINIGQYTSPSLDLDLDSQNDIKLENYILGGVNYQGASALFAGGKVVGFNSGGIGYVKALTAGNLIDSATAGPNFFGSMAYGNVNPNAKFKNAPDAYVGLGFPSGSNYYYGWVRVGVNNANGTFVVKDWAYDNSGAGIHAGSTQVPEPGTLGMLAAGGAGLLALRRRRNLKS
jgi:hypothetical protein